MHDEGRSERAVQWLNFDEERLSAPLGGDSLVSNLLN